VPTNENKSEVDWEKIRLIFSKLDISIFHEEGISAESQGTKAREPRHKGLIEKYQLKVNCKNLLTDLG